MWQKNAITMPFNYEEWLHRKAGEQMEEDRVAKSRQREIWNAILIHEMNEKWLKSLPYDIALKHTPRIRGCRAAAKRAGFAA